MVSLDGAGRQVGDFVVVALFFFGLTSVFGLLDPFVLSLGIDPPRFLGAVVAGVVGALVLVVRQLRLRLVVRVWFVGLTTTVLGTTLFVFFDLQASPLGILAAWLFSVALGVALAYPPFWQVAVSRLRPE